MVVAFVSQKFILFKILLSDTIHPVSIEFIGIPTHLCECPEFVGARGFLSLLSQVRYTVSHLFLLCRLYILNIEQDQADFFFYYSIYSLRVTVLISPIDEITYPYGQNILSFKIWYIMYNFNILTKFLRFIRGFTSII